MITGFFVSGKWSSPAVTGKSPPPCDDFTLTMVDHHRAVLFGGFSGTFVKHLYVLDISRMVSNHYMLHGNLESTFNGMSIAGGFWRSHCHKAQDLCCFFFCCYHFAKLQLQM